MSNTNTGKYEFTQSQYDRLIEWVQALESGKYKQTKYRLRKRGESNNYSYCCLGVADVVAKRHGMRGTKGEELNYNDIYVREFFGFECRAGFITKDGNTLITLNDSMDYTFKEIAEVIRRDVLNNCMVKG